jgi:hypothetical protein
MATGAFALAATSFFWPWRAAEWHRSAGSASLRESAPTPDPLSAADSRQRVASRDTDTDPDTLTSDLLRQSASGELYATVDASFRRNHARGHGSDTVQRVEGVGGRLFYEAEFWQRMTRCADARDSKRDLVGPMAIAPTTETSLATIATASPVSATPPSPSPSQGPAAFLGRSWFMCRDVYGSYHMTVDPETALGLAAVERVKNQRTREAAIKAAEAKVALELADRQKAADAAAKAAVEAALEAEKTRQWLASDSMNFDCAPSMPPPVPHYAAFPATCGRQCHCLKCRRTHGRRCRCLKCRDL